MNITTLIADILLVIVVAAGLCVLALSVTEPAPFTISEHSRLEAKCLRAGGMPASCANFAAREI